MVAIIHNGSSLRNALHYNENKVRQGAAECIHSVNYPKDTDLLNFKDKINRLEKLTLLNQQTKINSVHISLNLDPSERFMQEKLTAIAETYMQKIGFSEQPYLVYQHHDAGHPHLHIVTTNIKSDGRRIELHNLGGNQSMKASKEIEKEFSLVQALSKSRLHHELKPVNVQKVLYGKSESKRAITNVLDAVLPYYKYTSLVELNAVLRQYNVIADRGSEDSRIHKNDGLVYRILNERGEKIGVPIKASLIYNKPTLKFIQARFIVNNEARQRYKQRTKNTVDLAFVKQSKLTLKTFQQALQKEQIHVVFRQNEKSIIYGLTYVDHQTKCVFNGSDLGKQYSANAIQQKCSPEEKYQLKPKQALQSLQTEQNLSQSILLSTMSITNILQHLTEPEVQPVAPELKEEQRRKRKKQQHH